MNFEQILSRLVAYPTVSCADPDWDMGNREAAEFLANLLDDQGFDCEIQALPDRPGKVNLIARAGPADPDTGLVLAGHLDTVPYDDSGWASDPFRLDKRDDRLYGLGSCDMKGFIALAAETAARYARQPLAAPLVILASADEESGMDGARALLARGQRPARYAVIGEPTNLLPIHRHKGILMESIRVHGKAGHSSNPAHGLNSIEAMRAVMNEVAALRDSLAAEAAPGFPVPHPTLNLGVIRGGDSPNRIPALCELQVDLRFPPETGDVDRLRQALRDRATAALEATGCTPEFFELFVGTPAMDTPANSAVVRAAERLTGASSRAVDFCTEGAFYNQLGMESVILGPGDIAHAHQPNEHLVCERIEPMRAILDGLITEFCLSRH